MSVHWQNGRIADPDRYPGELVRDVVLRDGTRVLVRPIRPDDAQRLVDLYARLSRHTAYQRFFTIMRRLPPDWAAILAKVDYQRRLAIVAENDGEVVGVARWEPAGDRDDTVEVAFVVQDGWQNRGLGTCLFRDLLVAAQARRHQRFAYVLADNTRMLDLITRFADVEHRRIESGVVEVLFRLRKGREAFSTG